MQVYKYLLIGIILSLGVLVLNSCQRTYSEEDYLEYLGDEKNGLRHTEQLFGYIYTVQLLTEDWYRIKERNRGRSITSDLISEDELHFLFSVETVEGINPIKKRFSDGGDYIDLIRKLNQQVTGLFILSQEGVDYDCSFAQTESSYDMIPSLHITVVFSKINPKESFVLKFKDEIWGAGPIRFRFDQDKIEEIPVLK